MTRFILVVLLLTAPQGIVNDTRKQNEERVLAGIIYFTNNTPPERHTFPVELYTRNQKRRIAITRPDARGSFKLTGIKPGKYLLKFTWPPDHCTLLYKVDVTKNSNTEIEVIMDAACSKHNGAVRDLPQD
jgi:hypothetical protein